MIKPTLIDYGLSFGPLTPRTTTDMIVIHHTGNPEDDDFYNMTADSFLSLCQKHGTDRILFATDCPWADQKAYVDAFRSLPFTEEEKNAILGENALKLLGMTDTPAGN